jgi:2-(1,2-epoxy-1,2-dihydrophenyl)acetyl-CoA isomerase
MDVRDLIEQVDGRVATLTLNRPEQLNSFSTEMLADLQSAIARLGNNKAIGCIVLTGSGKAFSAGGNVKRKKEQQSFEETAEEQRIKQAIILAIRRSPKVFVASINGAAVGGGLALALACDLRLASASAKFGAGFRTSAVAGNFGLSWLLTQTVGTARARELELTGRVIDAEECLAVGMITRLVPDDQLSAATKELAADIASGPLIAFNYMKRNLFAAETHSLPDVMEIELMHHVRTAQTADHAEAMKAFAEKRKPQFIGA